MASELINGKFRLLTSLIGKGRNFDKGVFGEKFGFLSKIFGCGHQDLSRTFSHGKFGYRALFKVRRKKAIQRRNT
jgi:hypothetical protein